MSGKVWGRKFTMRWALQMMTRITTVQARKRKNPRKWASLLGFQKCNWDSKRSQLCYWASVLIYNTARSALRDVEAGPVGFDPTTSGSLQSNLEGRRSVHAELRARCCAALAVLSDGAHGKKNSTYSFIKCLFRTWDSSQTVCLKDGSANLISANITPLDMNCLSKIIEFTSKCFH